MTIRLYLTIAAVVAIVYALAFLLIPVTASLFFSDFAAEKMRIQAVLAELHEMQREIAELSEDYNTVQAVTEALVERFEHPELRLH